VVHLQIWWNIGTHHISHCWNEHQLSLMNISLPNKSWFADMPFHLSSKVMLQKISVNLLLPYVDCANQHWAAVYLNPSTCKGEKLNSI
jgi:hypothetical protein